MGETKHWETVADKTKEHWLEVVDPEGWYSAGVRFDGCIHLNQYFNVPLMHRTGSKEDEHVELEDYIHICDIDDMIARLQSLKAAALAHFGPDWDS